MGGLIRAHEWASTALGPVAGWPRSLKAAVDIVVASPLAMIVMWGPDLIQLYNDGYAGIAGDKHPRALGQAAHDCWPEAREFTAPVYADVLRGESRSFRDQKLILNRNGGPEEVWLDLYYSPLRCDAGAVGGILATVVDTTNRVRAEAALDATEERLRLAQEVAGVGTFEWDIENDVNHWSPEIERLYGLPEGSFGGTYADWARCIHPDDRPEAEARAREALETGELDAEWRVVRPTGETVWIHARAIVERTPDGAPRRMIGANIDISERRSAEQALRENESRLRTLVGELQHRTRNLIAVVRSIADRTLSSSSSLADFGYRFRGRLGAVARVQGMLSRLTDGEKVTFGGLLRSELFAHGAIDADGNSEQVTLDGQDVRLRSSTLQILALALHELTANALQHGALAWPDGRLRVGWRVEAGEEAGQTLLIDWQEHGVPMREAGPPGAPRKGYGRELIEEALPYQLQAQTRQEFGPDGVRCTIAVPLAADRNRGTHG